jgi:alpha-tubulin suppressor-like RCC1 family protein
MVRILRSTHRCCGLGILVLLGACEGSGPSEDQPTIIAVSAGATSTCALTDAGQAYCWGSIYTGEPPFERSRPDTVASGLRFRELKVASNTFGNAVCGVTTDQLGYCWGTLLVGYDTGIMIGETPQLFGQNIPLQTIAVGSRHYCGLAVDGAAYCAGDYTGGVRGTGGATGEFAEPDLVPNQVAGGLSYSELAVGLGNSCGLSVGQAYCWGSEIALGTTSAVLDPEEECGYTIPPFSGRCSHLPVSVEGGHTFVTLAAGQTHVCGITSDSSIYCWGGNESGQLGTGDTAYSVTPVKVALDAPSASISLGGNFSCALTTGGQAYCWGLNHVGQVGNGSTINNILAPVPVEGGATYRAISAGLNHACAIRTSGALYCWGSGQLGTGAPQVSTIPVRVHF